MRSRWFHVPLLHSHGALEKKVTWLELFYDLIFVAAFIQLGNGLSEHVDGTGVLVFCGVFVPLWTAWTGFTFFANRFTVDDILHRVMVFLQMFAVGGMALSAPEVLRGQHVPFALATAGALFIIALLHYRVHQQTEEGRDYCFFWGGVFLVSSIGWLASAFVMAHIAYWIWAGATVTILGAPMHRRSRELAERYPIDFEHLGERYGLLTLIVLGESFVKVLSLLAAEGAGLDVYAQAAVVLLVTCGVWWVYFDDVAGAHVRKGPAKWVVWLYAHLPLQAAIVATGVALKKAVHFTWDEPAGAGYRWLLAGAVALVFFAVAMVDSVTERKSAELSDRARINVRWISGVLLLVLAPAGNLMSGGLFLALLTGVVITQVILDVAMAPFEENEHSEERLGARSLADRVQSGEALPVRRDLTESVRKGTPSAMRRDLYFYFMEGSWGRIFVAFLIVFLVTNIFFGALYALEPGAVAGVDTFGDAFFFSVQTMSTIGYGALSPETAYGNAVVTAEAAIGIIGVAIVTGLVFAKASRATSSVLFSNVVTIHTHHGKPTLSFRAGNARGNEVVDATVSITLVKDVMTPEGLHLRKLFDVLPTRARSPLFVLSWQIMHPIEGDSPLIDVDWDAPEGQIIALIVTIMGHDGTYAQTIHARHTYYPEDFRVGHRFVDVISQLDDGRLQVDYGAFHDTTALPTDSTALPTDSTALPKDSTEGTVRPEEE